MATAEPETFTPQDTIMVRNSALAAALEYMRYNEQEPSVEKTIEAASKFEKFLLNGGEASDGDQSS